MLFYGEYKHLLVFKCVIGTETLICTRNDLESYALTGCGYDSNNLFSYPCSHQHEKSAIIHYFISSIILCICVTRLWQIFCTHNNHPVSFMYVQCVMFSKRNFIH